MRTLPVPGNSQVPKGARGEVQAGSGRRGNDGSGGGRCRRGPASPYGPPDIAVFHKNWETKFLIKFCFLNICDGFKFIFKKYYVDQMTSADRLAQWLMLPAASHRWRFNCKNRRHPLLEGIQAWGEKAVFLFSYLQWGPCEGDQQRGTPEARGRETAPTRPWERARGRAPGNGTPARSRACRLLPGAVEDTALHARGFSAEHGFCMGDTWQGQEFEENEESFM